MDVNNIPPRTTNRIIFITLNVLLSSHINNGMMNPVMVAPIIVSIMPILNFLFMIRFALLYMLSSKLNNNPNIITAIIDNKIYLSRFLQIMILRLSYLVVSYEIYNYTNISIILLA